MNIRYAKEEDAEVIAKNNVLLSKESENKEIIFETTLEGVKSVIRDIEKGFYIVVEEDEKILGELFITYEWSDWRNYNTWWIQSVYVEKNYRGGGVFKKMLEHVKNLSVENNVKNLKLYVHNENKKAIRAYEKNHMVKKPYYIYEIKI